MAPTLAFQTSGHRPTFPRMKAISAKSVTVRASGFWPFGLAIEPTREGLLLRPARQPRAGWVAAFRKAGLEEDAALPLLRNSANDFDRHDWVW